mgnify:CR=1 FL=1
MTDTRRPYRSKLRDDQARATRKRVVDAGAALFVAHGYASTTIDAIVGLIENGAISEAQIDASVARLERMAARVTPQP